MKLTAILLLVACLQVSARSNAQVVSLSEKGASLEKLFEEIKKQTGYTFWYDEAILKDAKRVDVNVTNVALQRALEIIFKDQPLEYSIVEKTIVVSRKQKVNDGGEDKVPPPPLIDVTGKVVDSTGKPITGASVKLLPGSKGAITNVDGDFLLKEVQPGSYTVEILFVGYEVRKLQITVGESNLKLLPLALQAKVVELDDVTVSTGYWTTARKVSTGNISKITAKTIERQPVSNPLQAMQGRMTGIYINQFTGVPGSNFEVRIRGTNSLQNGNNPFYVIDGIPFLSETLSDQSASASLYGKGVSPLNSINPSDIESIEVLKDADATAVYGSRGANGVILITTKKGKPGKIKMDINVNGGISKVIHRMKLLNTEQYLKMRFQAVANDGAGSPNSSEHDINGTWKQNRYTDWQDVLIGGSAVMTTINASMSGGSNGTYFRFSTGYDKQGVVFPGNNAAQKLSTNFSINHNSLDKKFNARFSTNYLLNNSDILSSDITGDALLLPPNAPALYNIDGSLNWENSTWINPMAWMESRFKANTANLLTKIEFNYEVVRKLKVSFNIGYNDFRNEERHSRPSSMYPPAFGYTSSISMLYLGRGNRKSLIIEPQVNWEAKEKKGRLAVLLGSTYQNQQSEQQSDSYRGFPSNTLINDPRSASFVSLDGYRYSEYRYAAIYGRVNYDWDGKYIFNITGRRDGSSRFGPGKQFANLGAIGFAWIFSNEKFVNHRGSFLSFGKVRGSYGITGNDQIGDYKFLNTYGSTGSSYQGVNGLVPTQLFNADYGWENNKKLEGALELGFFKDRIFLSAAWYRNRSSNQLVAYQLAGQTGFTSVLKNLPATVQNTGVELEAETVNISNTTFKWSSSVNITIFRNKLIEFPNIESTSYYNTYVVGKSLNIAKKFHYLGVNKSTGVFQFEDVNKDGVLTFEDKQSPVESGQKYYGGVNNSFSYKRLQIDVFIQFVKQSRNAFLPTYPPGYIKSNIPVSFLEGVWEKVGDDARAQFFSRSNADVLKGFSYYQASDALIEDASFIRIKNISISYQLPDLQKKVKGRLYVQAQNVFTFSKYSGMDPEGGSSLPPLSTFVAGIQLIF